MRCLTILIVAMLALSGCVAIMKTPPLSRSEAASGPTFSSVYLTSGRFDRPHTSIGVIQLEQEGYRWLHEREVVSEANPESILYKIGKLAQDQGADGVQNLLVVDLNPQSPEETTAKQVMTAIRVIQQIASRQAPTALGEGTKTRYAVKGELVKFEIGE